MLYLTISKIFDSNISPNSELRSLIFPIYFMEVHNELQAFRI